MKKKLKLLCSIITMFVCIATFAFGVYAASTLSYTMNGTFSYTMNNVFVDIETTLYRSTSTALITESIMQNSANSFKSGSTVTNTEIVSSYTKGEKVSTYNMDSNKFISLNDIATGSAKDLPINFGAYSTTAETAYAYYAVVTIKNVGQEKVSAVIKNKSGDLSSINSYIYNTGNIQVEGTTDPTVGVVGRIVFGFALKNEYDTVIKNFEYLISVSLGDYPDVSVTQIADVNSQYGFVKQESGVYKSNNKGVLNSVAVAEIDVYKNCSMILYWSVSCDSGCSLMIYVNGTRRVNENYDDSGNLELTLVRGDVVRIEYEKGSYESQNSSYTDTAMFMFELTA